MAARRRGEGGMTLIELLVVILIIGILAAIAIPAFLKSSNHCETGTMSGATRTYGSATETRQGDRNAASIRIAADNRGIEWQAAKGFTVTEAYIWKPTSSDESPIRFDKARIHALNASEWLTARSTAISGLGRNASVVKIQLCLVKG